MRSLAFVWLVALAACGSDLTNPDPLFESDTSGSLKLPLRGIDADGRSYRLRQGTFELNGTAMMTLDARNDARSLKSLSAPLPSGHYQAFLRAGFQLVEVAEDGSEHPVEAVLSSPNPMRFDVDPRSDQQLGLTFRRGDHTIALGDHSSLRIGGRTGAQGVLAIAPTSP